MIEGITDSQFLDMLAYWFEIQLMLGTFQNKEGSNDITERLRGIAKKLAYIDENFDDEDLCLK